MNHFTRIPTGFSVDQALNELGANPWMWDQITLRQDFVGSDHKDTQTIYIRGPKVWTGKDYMATDNAQDYFGNINDLPEVAALVREAACAVGARDLGYVMVVRLNPGGRVTPHIDEGPYADHYTRFHLVLSTNRRCVMRSGAEWAHMAEGELWQFDHKAEHEFVNEGDTERIHIIFDAVPRPDLKVCVTGRGGATLPDKLEIRESTVDEMLQVAPILFQEHWDEVARNKGLMVLKPHEEAYRAMEAGNMLLILGAYKGGEMVGYSVNFLLRHPHYADLEICQNDLLFIAKEHRNGPLGIRLMKRTEIEGKARGARLMLWHAKEGTPLAAILPRMGYGVQDIIFSREV
jgi:GNAT superfamily N-acetyltransferase